MARIPMVTRTITSTKATLMCVDKVQGEIFNKTVVMPRTYKSNAKLLKAIEKKHTDENVKIVDIVDSEIITAKYGMPEEKFVELAELM